MNIPPFKDFATFLCVLLLLAAPLFVRASAPTVSIVPTVKVSVRSNAVSLQVRNSNVEPGYNKVEIYHSLHSVDDVSIYSLYETPVASKGIFVIRPSSFEVALSGLIKDPGSYTVVIGSESYQELHHVDIWPDCDEISDVSLEQYENEDELLHASINVSGLAPGELGIRYLVRHRFVFDSSVPSSWTEELFSSGGNDLHLYLEGKGEKVEFEVRRLCDGYSSSFSIASDWLPAGEIELKKKYEGCIVPYSLKIEEVGATYATLKFEGEVEEENSQFWILYGPREIEELDELKEVGTEILISTREKFELIGLNPSEKYRIFYGVAFGVKEGSYEDLCISEEQLEFETGEKRELKESELPPQERSSCGQPFDTIPTLHSFPDPCYEFEEGDVLRLGGVYLATVVEASLPQITQAQIPVIDTIFDPKDGSYTYDTIGYETVTLDCFYETATVEIQLPFQDKVLLVDLSDFSVNEFGAIVGGNVIPQRQNVNVLPNVIAPIVLGSNFCNPPPQSDLPVLYPGQAYGFDTTGVYDRTPPFPGYRNGDLYDRVY